MRVCITGGSGTLGHYLQQQLSAETKMAVLSLLRPESPEPVAHPNIETVRVDFRDPETLAKTVRRFEPDAVVHAAASGMKESERARWFEMTRFNVGSTLSLLESIAPLPGCHYVYVSTGLAYTPQGRPLVEADPLGSTHPYGASKAATELLLRSGAESARVPLTVLRPFSFTGVNDHTTRLFPTILAAASSGAPARLGDPDQVRDFSAAEDIADGILRALTARQSRPGNDVRVYNLGSATRQSLRQMLEQVTADLALPVELAFNTGERRSAPVILSADTTAARESLAWRPRVRLSYAVWELARSRYPELEIREPAKWL